MNDMDYIVKLLKWRKEHRELDSLPLPSHYSDWKDIQLASHEVSKIENILYKIKK
jgi:hypothetical protein